MISISTSANSPLKYSKWDEQGMYIPIPDLETIRNVVVDYIELLSSNSIQYNTKSITQARLLLMQLGGDKS
jgi:hypothetical protein